MFFPSAVRVQPLKYTPSQSDLTSLHPWASTNPPLPSHNLIDFIHKFASFPRLYMSCMLDKFIHTYRHSIDHKCHACHISFIHIYIHPFHDHIYHAFDSCKMILKTRGISFHITNFIYDNSPTSSLHFQHGVETYPKWKNTKYLPECESHTLWCPYTKLVKLQSEKSYIFS
jgi:hypothetical protein